LWRDEALLLDMPLAAGDALGFVEGMDRAPHAVLALVARRAKEAGL
jgi:hypothetical protein